MLLITWLTYRAAVALIDCGIYLDRWARRRQAPNNLHVYSETAVVLPVSAEEETRPLFPPAAGPHPRIRRWVTGPGHRASGRVLITPWARPALETP